MTPDALDVAVRAYATRPIEPSGAARHSAWRPTRALVFDCETRAAAGQHLTFGAWRCYRIDWPEAPADPTLRCVEEGLFHEDALPARELAILRRYAARRKPSIDPDEIDSAWQLRLLTREEFVNWVLCGWARKTGAAIVGFNLPFDLSRLAVRWAPARRGRSRPDGTPGSAQFVGGFTFRLGEYATADGTRHNDRWIPYLGIKTIDSKRSLIGFRASEDTDFKSSNRAGNFVDVRSLAYALTETSYSLRSAAGEFLGRRRKLSVEEHGRVTARYLDYCRRDVELTGELFGKLIGEYLRHPISLSASKAYSAASIGKAYLAAMGVKPILARQPDFPESVLARGMTAYYGGRAECRVRRVPVPVVYCDFLSMYPTVNALMGLWRFVTARTIGIDEHAADEAQRILNDATADTCFDPDTWKHFPMLVEIQPDDDILPVRARYADGGTWQIGVNPLTSNQPLWYALPDLIAAKLLSPTNRTPRVLRAIKLTPLGKQRNLKPARLRGEIECDPRDDLFRSVIEARKTLKERGLPEGERKRLDRFLKVLANATSYGIYAEMTRHEQPRNQPANVTVHRADGASTFHTDVAAPEELGSHFFSPMAALITSAARLMLALAEHEVTRRGGTYAFCDTDSLAIVASQHGGLIPCPGGDERPPDGGAALRALTWPEVDEIAHRFTCLNPYDHCKVRGSVLELEDENFDDAAKTKQRQLYCYSISAKRYALYTRDPSGTPQLRTALVGARNKLIRPGEKWSEHGLGHLLDPIDRSDDEPRWPREVWDSIVTEAHTGTRPEVEFERRPAIGRATAGRPRLLEAFKAHNDGQSYAARVKPFNFLLSAHVAAEDRPESVEGSFHLVAPFETDPNAWESLPWMDRHTREPFQITTAREPTRSRVRVATVGKTLDRYRVHPESKSSDSAGNPCGAATVGLLHRRPVVLSRLHYIGKESNELDERTRGMSHPSDEAETEYLDPRARGQEARRLLNALARVGYGVGAAASAIGVDRKSIQRWNAGTSEPSEHAYARLEGFARMVISEGAKEGGK